MNTIAAPGVPRDRTLKSKVAVSAGSRRITIFLLIGLSLTGCVGWSEDGGLGVARNAAKTHLGKELTLIRSAEDETAVRARVRELLQQPLGADAAVEIALINNRGLQAAYNELGIAEADFVQAGRLPNPKFSFERLTRASTGALEISRMLTFNVLGIVTMPLVWDIEGRRFEQAKSRAAGEVLRLAYDTKRAYYGAVAAQETYRYMEQVRESAEAGAELARRMRRAGNFSRLQEARERLFYAGIIAQLARARQGSLAERERLTRLLGLWGEDITFKLPDRLPALPASPRELGDVEATAMGQRLDVQMAQREVEGLAKSLGLTRATGFVNVLELSFLRNKESSSPRQTGYGIEVSIPIFDFGDAKMAKAEQVYRQGMNRVSEIAINARSQVRESYDGYRTAYDIARHFQKEVVPIANRISEENILRYNGMLIGTFDLLSDLREQIQQVMAAIDAQREFWVAEANLDSALTDGGGGGGGAPRPMRMASPAKAEH